MENNSLRRIKFRAWDEKAKNWVNDKVCIFHDSSVYAYGHTPLTRMSTDDDVEISQYTGLKDRNGEEIYEGDILRGGHYCKLDQKWHSSRSTKVVQWRNTIMGAGFNIGVGRSRSSELKNYEIIGNIYENQELVVESLSPPNYEKNYQEKLKKRFA